VQDYLVAGTHADASGDVQHIGTSAGVAVFRCYRADIVERETEKSRPFWRKEEVIGWHCEPIPCHSIHLVLNSTRTEQQAAAFAVDGLRLTRHNVYESCGYGELSVPDCISPAESFSDFEYRKVALSIIMFRRVTEFSSLQHHMQKLTANGARMHRDGVLCICRQMLVALEEICKRPLESFLAPTVLHPDTWLLRFCGGHFTDDVSLSGISSHYKSFCVVLDVFASHQPSAPSPSFIHHYTLNPTSTINAEQQRIFSTALVIAELVTGRTGSDIVSSPSPSNFVWQHCSHDMFDLATWICPALDSKKSCEVRTLESFTSAFHLFVAKGAARNSAIFQWELFNPARNAFEQLSAVDNHFLESCFLTQPPTTSGCLPHAALDFDIEAPLRVPTALGRATDSANHSACALRRILVPTFRVQPYDFWLWQRLQDGHSWVPCAPGEAAALEHARVRVTEDGDSVDDNRTSSSCLRRITIAAARLCRVQIPFTFAVEPFCVRASAAEIERMSQRVHVSLPEYVC
jgi:hypothetical protein